MQMKVGGQFKWTRKMRGLFGESSLRKGKQSQVGRHDSLTRVSLAGETGARDSEAVGLLRTGGNPTGYGIVVFVHEYELFMKFGLNDSFREFDLDWDQRRKPRRPHMSYDDKSSAFAFLCAVLIWSTLA
jgi:hypothetical protein